MNKKLVTLIHTDEFAAQHIESSLNSTDLVLVEKLSFNNLTRKDLLEKSSLIVVQSEYFNDRLITGLLTIADVYQQIKFLVIASQISLSAYKKVSLLKNIFILQEPFDSRIFSCLIKELLSKNQFDMSRFPRFVTNEPARMLILETGLLIPTRMRNYSVGGAFLEYKGISLRVGNNMHLNILNHESVVIKDIKDKWQLSAKVIWIREGDNRLSTSRGVGVQFTQVY